MEIEVTEELIWSLWLTLVFGPANPLINRMLEKYGSAAEAHRALMENREPEIKSILKHKSKIYEYDESSCEKIIEECKENDIGILLKSDERYPQNLLDIYNPPAVLYYKGDISSVNSSVCFSIVGTRNPSLYSIKAASAISRSLASCGFVIVSGFAVGIDITSHMAAISGGSKSYAVMGCGLNVDYPKENFKYRNKLFKYGAMFSEYPPSYRPTTATFPPRNRIIAGMSLGTAVIEAGTKSGSLITANHCNDQGKPLFVVPPADIFELCYGGNVALMRDGAIPLFSARDIIYEFYPENADKLSEKAEKMITSMDFINAEVYKRTGMGPGRRRLSGETPSPLPPLSGTFGHKSVKTKKTKPEKTARLANVKANKKNYRDFSYLPEEQRIIAEVIYNYGKPIITDMIAAEADMNISDVLSAVTDMELDGIIVCGAGGGYTLV